MATFAQDDIREELTRRGRWADYVRMCEDLTAKGKFGITGRLSALKKVAPDLVSWVKGVGRPKGSKSKGVGDCGEVADGGAGASKSNKANCQKLNPAIVRAANMVTRSTFVNKKCSLRYAVMWAYTSLCYKRVFPKEAPSATAWQLYLDMKRSPAFAYDMISKAAAKEFARNDLEDNDKPKMDGEREYDLLGSILKANGEAVDFEKNGDVDDVVVDGDQQEEVG